MPLTKEQNKVYKDILAWLVKPNSREAVLDAMAGTGKSFLINYIQKHIIDDYQDLCKLLGIEQVLIDTRVSATTNKAVSSLHEIGCRDAETTCQTIGAVLKYDSKLCKSVLVPMDDDKFHRYLIIIDECSMIDWRLYQLIATKTDTTCKILYCGDKNQLAPVKCISGISPVYLNKNLEIFSLTTLIRSKKFKELQDLAYQLHDNVDLKSFEPIKTFKGVIDWYTTKEDQIKELDKFKDENYNAKVIAYTNETVGLYTDYIRKLRGYTEDLEVGETYITNNYYRPSFARADNIPTDSTIKILKKSSIDSINIPGSKFNIPVYHAHVIVNNKSHRDVVIAADKTLLRNVIKRLKPDYPALALQVATRILLLDYAHSCTIHKAQGSTVNTVYIDCKDISTCRNSDTVARLLYVAATRATDRIVFLNNLAPRYGSFIK